MENFEETLRDFFTKHDKSKLKIVPKLVKNFTGQEQEVLSHLNKRYKTKIQTEHKMSEHNKEVLSEKVNSSFESELEFTTSSKKKSKKKRVIIVLLGVVLVGGGVAAYLFKDKILNTNHPEEVSTTEESVEQTSTKIEEPKTEEVKQAIIDSVEAALEAAEPAAEDGNVDGEEEVDQ